jgi:hypothetical protein
LSRANFSSSTLVRLLAQATGAGTGATVQGARQDVAERLSQWLNAFDAVALHGIHQSVTTAAVAPPPSGAVDAAQQAATEQFQRTRAALVAAITGQARPAAPGALKDRGATLRRVPAPPPAPDEPAVDYSSFFKRHLELQRDMALKIAPLRAQVRQVLAQVPVLLEKRFEQLCEAPGAGPVAFRREWEAIVLAELNLRLQPVVGLMEAWGASPQTTQ